MKKHLFLAAAFAALTFASCKKEDNSSSQTNSQKIVGTWTASFGAVDANGNKTLDESEKTTLTSANGGGTLTFNSNGSGTASTIDTTLPFTWKINNNTDLVVTSFSGVNTTYIQTLTSNQLVYQSRGSVYAWYGFTK